MSQETEWQDALRYVSQKDDHSVIWEREFFRRVVPWLVSYVQALEQRLARDPRDQELAKIRRWFMYMLFFVLGAAYTLMILYLSMYFRLPS